MFSYLWLLGRGTGLGAASLESFPGAFTGARGTRQAIGPQTLGLSPQQAKSSTAVRTMQLAQELGRGSHLP